MYEQQEFQSNARLFALKLHAAYEKVENVILYPFRRLGLIAGETGKFQEADKPVAQPISE